QTHLQALLSVVEQGWVGTAVGCFFQAEDGIRDFHVTGVQTCALPILMVLATSAAALARLRRALKQALRASTSCAAVWSGMGMSNPFSLSSAQISNSPCG